MRARRHLRPVRPGSDAVTPNCVTIITPIRPGREAACRQYLRDHADPQADRGNEFLQCRHDFRFDRIESLHFCSFVILDGMGGIPPRLVFEATFDGSRDDFLDRLLTVAPDGLDTVYRLCTDYPGTDYPGSGGVPSTLFREYLVRHDVGSDTFFRGSPGRTVSQIRDEGRIRDDLVSFLSTRCQAGARVPGRAAAIHDLVRDFIRGGTTDRWTEQPVRGAWEIARRRQVAVAAAVGAFLVACGLGAIFYWAVGDGPEWLHWDAPAWLQVAGEFGKRISQQVARLVPLMSELVLMISPETLWTLVGLGVAWLVIRVGELVLRGLSRDLRDQGLLLRFPLQIAVLIRYALAASIMGAVLLAAVSGANSLQARHPSGSSLTWSGSAAVVAQLVCLGALFLIAWHRATSLKLKVELRPLGEKREVVRRMKLDLVQFAMLLLLGYAILLVALLLPQGAVAALAMVVRPAVHVLFRLMLLAVTGAVVAYAIGLLALSVIRFLERRDASKFENPAGLMKHAHANAPKYAREESGINRYQNHLASVTWVKPGLVRRWLLRAALFAINLLARFWFNRGELGGIPTILSARWVLIDDGRRLLFLDNYGGSWESYLNEFIDLAAVKGLNAIWSNTFVNAAGRSYGFPATRFLFWQGAQDARPFKAYVRQSQVETIAWYSAYPTLSVVNINANTETRELLFRELRPAAVDRLLQGL